MDKLGNLYDRLTPKERYALMVAAKARGDDSELIRLRRATKHTTLRVSDCYPVAHALTHVATAYIARQLDLLAQFFHLMGLGVECRLMDLPTGDSPNTESCLANQFVANADAWKQFCAGIGFDPDALLSGRIGIETVQRLDPVIRFSVCSHDEAVARRRAKNPDAAPITTAAELADGMREAFDAMAGKS